MTKKEIKLDRITVPTTFSDKGHAYHVGHPSIVCARCGMVQPRVIDPDTMQYDHFLFEPTHNKVCSYYDHD